MLLISGHSEFETGLFSAECHSVDCSGDSKVLTELGSNKIKVIVLDDQSQEN